MMFNFHFWTTVDVWDSVELVQWHGDSEVIWAWLSNHVCPEIIAGLRAHEHKEPNPQLMIYIVWLSLTKSSDIVGMTVMRNNCLEAFLEKIENFL